MGRGELWTVTHRSCNCWRDELIKTRAAAPPPGGLPTARGDALDHGGGAGLRARIAPDLSAEGLPACLPHGLRGAKVCRPASTLQGHLSSPVHSGIKIMKTSPKTTGGKNLTKLFILISVEIGFLRASC